MLIILRKAFVKETKPQGETENPFESIGKSLSLKEILVQIITVVLLFIKHLCHTL